MITPSVHNIYIVQTTYTHTSARLFWKSHKLPFVLQMRLLGIYQYILGWFHTRGFGCYLIGLFGILI